MSTSISTTPRTSAIPTTDAELASLLAELSRPTITIIPAIFAPDGKLQRVLPTIEEMQALEDDPASQFCWPPPPATSFRQLVSRLLPPEHGSRGIRMQGCMSCWRWMHDGDHYWSQPLSACDLTILCPRCAVYQAWENYNHYRPLVETVEARGGFTRLSIPTDIAAPKKSFDFVCKRLKKRIGSKTPTILKIRPVQGTIEALCCDDIDSAKLAALLSDFPGLRFRRHTLAEFDYELKNVLAPDIPQHPKDADLASPEVVALAQQIADLDTKYKGIRLLRIMGLTREERRKLSTKSESAIVDNFHMDSTHSCGECGEPTLMKLPRCPQCRKVAIRFTKYGQESAPPTDPTAWTEVVLYVPPASPPLPE